MTNHQELDGIEVPAAPQVDPPPKAKAGHEVPVWAVPPMLEVSLADGHLSVTLHFKSIDRMTDWLKWFRHTTRHRRTKRPNYRNGTSVIDKIRGKP